jgi:cytochrome oxidase assembly protein ShyY1
MNIMHTGAFYSLTVLTLATIIIVYMLKTWQIKIQAGKEQAYQKMSEELLALQRNTSEHQKQILQELQDLNNRMKNVEKILREVE